MARMRDPAAVEQAVRRWGLPACLHVPIVAVDQAAIEDCIGTVTRVISPGRALLVEPDPPEPRDPGLPIWQHPQIDTLFCSPQVWVAPAYTRYRWAWRRALGEDAIRGMVLHHVYNRRAAQLRGFGYIRVVPVSRAVNSSSAFSETWGVEWATPAHVEAMNAIGLRIQYADLCDLAVLLGIAPGGGVMEAIRLAQDLVTAPLVLASIPADGGQGG